AQWQSMGSHRSLTIEFLAERAKHQASRRCATDEPSLDEQLCRLRIGFVEWQRSSLLHSLASGNDWWTLTAEQLARVQLDSGLGCALCLAPPAASVVRRRFQRPTAGCCRVCGRRVCDACSTHDLLLYCSDCCTGELGADPVSAVQWALIGQPGCPEVEPRRSRQLRICRLCRDGAVEMMRRATAEAADPSAELVELYKGHRRLAADLTARWSAVASLSAPLLEPRQRGADLSSADLRRLAKSLGDLSALLDDYHVYLEGVRTASGLAQHPSESVRRCHTAMRACFASGYADWRAKVRRIRADLDRLLPADCITQLARLADRDALQAVHLQASQLVYEILHRQRRQPQVAEFAPPLIRLCQSLEDELRPTSDDWEADSRAGQLLIKERLLRRPLLGAAAGLDELRARLARRLSFLAEQLEERCSGRAAPGVKLALQQTLDGLLSGQAAE
ncbi:hypothetical protein BOX15_Mlig025010g1, partial [Macrostomum lignano]